MSTNVKTLKQPITFRKVEASHIRLALILGIFIVGLISSWFQGGLLFRELSISGSIMCALMIHREVDMHSRKLK